MRINNKKNIRDLFIGLDEKICNSEGRCIEGINFDNAATTPPIKSCIDCIYRLGSSYASIGRGTGQKAQITTDLYHASKEFIMDFFNVRDKDKYIVIYVNNTTEGINKLAKTLLKENDDEVVISSRMEHHSNDLPWRNRGKVDYIEVDDQGRLKIDELEKKLKNNLGKVKYVSLTGASNVTGYVNDIHKIARIVHEYDAKLIIDAAQLIPHKKVEISGETEAEDIDFLVFSSHKIYSPFGVGVIIGLKEEFEKTDPDYAGGGTVDLVLDEKVFYLPPPDKEEAGTPNFFGVMSLINSLSFMNTIGYDYIEEHEKLLLSHTLNGLKSIPGIINYGDMDNINDRLGIATFNVDKMYHRDVAEILAKKNGISVRHGWFCAHPYCRRLMNVTEKEAGLFLYDSNEKMPGMIRISFAIYNSLDEVDTFLNVIEDICKDNRKK
ncbi:aminotransferase class V-fold PLP-dependent enzyme [uncultured Clostridium sp.]|uniref:aminotransferase class V-fold PLP-dependent enzyme n=1 Tax=uncultured Clostridium sp. TaxID=59620 RepID=UPI0025FB001E|nr:aminotransferase class V-fold PLP-dependent enzyme [uncultured Clostridium sp.]